MKIVIIGAKASGKSSFGEELRKVLDIPCVELDDIIEKMYEKRHGARKPCREIFDSDGEEAFRGLEEEAVAEVSDADWTIIITGGSTFMCPRNRRILRKNAIVIFCKCPVDTLVERVQYRVADSGGVSKAVFLKWYRNDVAVKDEIHGSFADIVLDTGVKSPHELAGEAEALLAEELAVRCTSANTFGELIRVTTFGESHGSAIGAVLDGMPPGIPVTEEDIQKELDRRKPGQSSVTTPRREQDGIHVVSGLFEGRTTGAPVGMIVYNRDIDSSKYEALKELFRPGHADFTLYRKYGLRDHRGGGRSSGRETAGRVAAGAVAGKILGERGVHLYAHALEIGGVRAGRIDHGVIEKNLVRCADEDAAARMVAAIEDARDNADSVGGVVQLDILGLPPGLGDPVFAKLDARLTFGIMTLGAVKGVEIGAGFAAARLKGSEANDQLDAGGHLTNNAGGILGGISTGEPVTLRIAVKPTPSIARAQKTVDKQRKPATVTIEGRHDPCIVPRIIPVIENMAALVVLDAWEIQKRLRGGAWPEDEPDAAK